MREKIGEDPNPTKEHVSIIFFDQTCLYHFICVTNIEGLHLHRSLLNQPIMLCCELLYHGKMQITMEATVPLPLRLCYCCRYLKNYYVADFIAIAQFRTMEN
jgi:hypothetical protein